MAVVCPHCGQNLKIKDAKPGRYKPKCKKCSQQFSLSVPNDPNAPPVARTLEEAAQRKAQREKARQQAKENEQPAPASQLDEQTPLAAPVTEVPAVDAEKTLVQDFPAPDPPADVDKTLVQDLPPDHEPTQDTPIDTEKTLVQDFVPEEGAGDTEKTLVQDTSVPAAEIEETFMQETANPQADVEETLVQDAPISADPAAVTHNDVDQTLIHESSSATNSPPNSGEATAVGGTEATLAPSTGVDGPTAPDVTPVSPGSDGAPAGKPTSGTLGGYKLIRELGSGAMGSVYLARQLSLDREVALKTIQTQWADNPIVIARFVREAYAAAQLTHHNVVQIYDMGSEKGTNFFSMEYVPGCSLADLIEKGEKIEPDVAVGYILQAARGLRFAHQHGMIHRDIKPANLMLSEQGIVKVADLGLVKTPELLEDEDNEKTLSDSLQSARADVTMANTAMGTPAYMAPEQADDAKSVDHRADIYSLGCSLYVLLTGRPPFEGASALEVITKHKTEPVVRPEEIDESVPQQLSEVVVKMIAKDPADRYGNLEEVIQALETYMGGTDRLLSEEHVAELESNLTKFNGSSAAKLRKLIGLVFALVCVVLGLGTCLFHFQTGTGFFVMLGMAVVSYFVISGIREGTHLFDRVRAWVFHSRWTDWLTYLVGGLLLLVVLFFTGALVPWVVLGIFGILAGVAYHFAIDAKLKRDREPAITATETLLKSLRLKGIDEGGLREFVAKYSGNDWEEFFEALFSYEAKLEARQQLADAGQKKRKRFRAWREPIINRIDARLQSIREARDRKHLEQVEAAGLEAAGVSAAEARQQAANMADAVVQAATEKPETAPEQVAKDPKVAAAEKRARMKAMLAEARSGKYSRRKGALGFLHGPIGFLFGPKIRFLLGCLLLFGCGWWIYEHEFFTQLKEALFGFDFATLGSLVMAPGEPISWPIVGGLFTGFVPGIAGFALVFLSFFRGGKMSLFAIPAGACMVFLPPMIGLGAGLLLCLIGLIFGRTPED